MEYYYADYLAHKGVKGAKWGIRRHQKYGTGYIRKGGKTGIEMLIGDSSNKTPELIDPAADSPYNEIPGTTNTLNITEEERKKSDVREGVLWGLKTFIDLANVNVTGLKEDAVRYGEWGMSKLKTLKNDARIFFAEDDESGILDRKKKSRHFTEDEDMAAVNPSYKNFDANTKSNCMLCTTTYDLRRRGYDVTADKASTGFATNELKRWYPDAKIKTGYTDGAGVNRVKTETVDRALKGENHECTKKTVEALLNQPDGARGNLMVSWGSGSGHSVVYEIKKRKVIIRDCQTNTVYRNPDDILKYCVSSEYARLDNIHPDKRYLEEVLK